MNQRKNPRSALLFAAGTLAAALPATIAVGNGGLLPARAADVMTASLTFGLAAALAGGWASWRLARGLGSATRAAAAAVSLVGGAMLGVALVLAVNKLADGSAGVEHRARIAKKSRLSNRQDDDRYDRTTLRNTVSVASWLDEGKLIEVHVVGVQSWERLQVGDEIAVSAHPGAIGWPWVEAYRAP